MKPFDLRIENLRLTVPDGEEMRTIFASSCFALPQGALLGVRGESGSGKSTFLKLISGILTPTEGKVLWGETVLSGLPESERDRWRGENCGFLFQDFRLFEDLSAEENVLLPATFYRRPTADDRKRAKALLLHYGVRPGTRAAHLSRGEMQRTALARVLFAEPKVILADEPTASLDGPRAEEVTLALIGAAKRLGATLILVSHDPRVLAHFPEKVAIAEGRLVEAD